MGNKSTEVNRIIQLITKEFTLGLEADERNELDEWLSQSHQNKALYEKMQAESFVKERTEKLGRFDVSEGWSRVVTDINPRKKIMRVRRLLLHAASVAASILIVVGLYFLIDSVDQLNKQVVADSSEQIQPGSNKAILTLAGGEQVELADKDTTIHVGNTEIEINANAVNYSGKTKNGDNLKFNTLKTPRGGEYQLKLADGTLVWLNAESELKYPEQFTADNRTVYVKGEMYFEVAKDVDKPFIVHVNENTIQVLGTAFNVRAYYESKESQVTLAEGSISLNSNGTSKVLKPNQQAVIGADKTIINEVDASQFSAWKDGMFLYRRATLENILNDLSRWYNTKVFYTNQQIKYSKYSVYVRRYENITSILEMLEATGEVKIAIEGINLVVSPVE